MEKKTYRNNLPRKIRRILVILRLISILQDVLQGVGNRRDVGVGGGRCTDEGDKKRRIEEGITHCEDFVTSMRE